MLSEQFTEYLVRQEMKFDIGEMDFGYVYPQGNVKDIIQIEQALKQAGGKPKNCALDDMSLESKGKAKPEFIIRFNQDLDILIVIECKKQVKYHRSMQLDKPEQYAVDGVLYYAKYLKQYFNIIAIAVSGSSLDKSLLDVYFWHKNQEQPIYQEKYHNIFLTPVNYLKAFKGEKISKAYSLSEIKATALNFHDKLREIKISEIEKPILIAGILIALEDERFLQNYAHLNDFNFLFDLLNQAIKNVLSQSDIKNENVQYILNTFFSIANNVKFKEIDLMKDGSLRWYIQELEIKIKPMMNNADFTLDALGIFYHEFIKYSGGDGKGLGIVLTPQHLTDFMCDLAEINEQSKVIDICCGSASFLVTSMHKMFKCATDEQFKIIREKHLYGIELDKSLHMLAIANMIVRKDGKSNIIHGDCFNDSTIQELKNKLGYEQLDIGLLNPPYSQKDKEELEFVEQLLSVLKKDGIAVVVVPMSCAIGTKFKDTRQRLFEKHTLKAVFSMPDDIFYPTGTNVCVMIWQAHKPHSTQVKTFFGYYKNDGFIKRKKLGRIDALNTWQEIKQQWLELYRNSEEKAGLSVKYSVKHSDEWLAESYMQTDYSHLVPEHFERTIRDYLAYLVKFGLTSLDKKDIFQSSNLILNIEQWKEFSLTEYFDVQRGTRLTQENRIQGNIPLITAGEGDLGVKDFIANDEQTIFSQAITIDMFCNSYTHYDKFCADDNILILKPKNKMSKEVMLFINTMIMQDKYRYQYGRQYRQKNFIQHKIKLPIDKNGQPDWQFMHNYMQQFPYASWI